MSSSDSDENIRKSFLTGFITNIAARQRKSDQYRTLKHGKLVYIHPSSVLYENSPPWILYTELLLTSKEFMKNVLEIDPHWILDEGSHFYDTTQLNLIRSAIKS